MHMHSQKTYLRLFSLVCTLLPRDLVWVECEEERHQLAANVTQGCKIAAVVQHSNALDVGEARKCVRELQSASVGVGEEVGSVS